jgi:hypothetical protein
MNVRRVDTAGLAIAGATALAFYPQQAHAHLIETGLGPVYDGITHFAVTAEDLIPILGLAVFAGLRGKNHARSAIIALPSAWLASGILGVFWNVALPGSLAWLPLIVLGGLVAADLSLPITATVGIAVTLGIVRGLSNGLGMAESGADLRGVAGSTGAVFVVMTLGAACVTAWQKGWLRIAWRVTGSWVAASGLLLLGWSLR